VKDRAENFIGVSFSEPVDGFTPYVIDPKTENEDLVKRYYNRRIFEYFRYHCDRIVQTGFINENIIWVPAGGLSTADYWVFERFFLQVKLRTVSDGPELYISHQGQTKVLRKTVHEMIQQVPPRFLKHVIVNNQVVKYEEFTQWEEPDYEAAFPVLNNPLRKELGLPAPNFQKVNRYIRYRKYIAGFYCKFLNTLAFREVIPLHQNFLPVCPTLIRRVFERSNDLQFETDMGWSPKISLLKSKPYRKTPYNKIHLFFIAHQSQAHHIETLKECFKNGFGNVFRGMYKYVYLSMHPEKECDIVFNNIDNPLPEIIAGLDRNQSLMAASRARYIAVYISPYGKFEPDLVKRKIYFRVKQELLKREITSQTLEAAKIRTDNPCFGFNLTNIAVAMLGKLDGIPWRLPEKVVNELIVGVGAFRYKTENVQYIGSTISFNNEGRFKGFDCFLKHEVDILAGKIADAVAAFVEKHNYPTRLIIHFYKKLKQKDLEHIQKALDSLKLPRPIPIYIVTINKTETEDIIAFDQDWEGLMPQSGTIIQLEQNKYLLFNSCRYPGIKFDESDGYPFPIKLSIDCNEKKRLEDREVVRELVNQVYQFSRMYWKALRQQNIPVTIKYPEMVAKMIPHFEGNVIPEFGKNNLWFL
jgi:hypothetical protein